jgi:hypothetical protein
MALIIKCDKCKRELDVPGALLFGPPENDTCVKWHLCAFCYDEALEFLDLGWFTKNQKETFDDDTEEYGTT